MTGEMTDAEVAAQIKRREMCNLANMDTALRGGLIDLIALRLMCVGAGPTLD